MGNPADFAGLRVISLESRRADQMDQLIRRHGGDPFVAPSVKEVPFEHTAEVQQWAARLFAGQFDLIVLMTGAGLTFLSDTLAGHFPPEALPRALRRITIVSRGPKPVAVLRDMGVAGAIVVPEPNTWREIVPILAARQERRITIQEYGRSNRDLVAAIEALGAEVCSLSIYRWALPDDPAPLLQAARRIARRECEVVLFTTSIQLTHLLDAAASLGCQEAVRQALQRDIVIGSVGPVMDQTLLDLGFSPDIVPPHPKMAALVRAAAEQAGAALFRKRGFLPRPNFSPEVVR